MGVGPGEARFKSVREKGRVSNKVRQGALLVRLVLVERSTPYLD